MTSTPIKVKIGPEPVLLSRKEVDALYETLQAVINALDALKVDYIITGGSLLGAIRQHSILFCDDDIDMAIIDYDGTVYDKIVVPHLQEHLGNDFVYQIKPWEGGDRIRPKRMNTVFLDLFVLRRYDNRQDLRTVIGKKKNRQDQPESYIKGIFEKMEECAYSQGEKKPLWPCWQFATRKAVEMWTKEVYRENELFPLQRNLKMGPVTGIKGPRMPVRLLKRAFGLDCFEVYYQSASHKNSNPGNNNNQNHCVEDSNVLKPLVAAGGTWEGGQKMHLADEHYLPMQPISKAMRRPTSHCRETLMQYLKEQERLEDEGSVGEATALSDENARPNRTVYMDGVFDLFHIGHLKAIQQCATLGTRVILGVTGDVDAAGYKRPPIVPQEERVAIVEALDMVDHVVCPCPLIVTEEFMKEQGIDLVVHGFANDEDAERQRDFFQIPIDLGKFRRISYHTGLSTTERIQIIQKRNNTDAKSDSTNKDIASENKKTQWFGHALACATNKSETIPYDPFPFHLRQVIEPHIEKARANRKEALSAIRLATGEAEYDKVMQTFQNQLRPAEGKSQLHDSRIAQLRAMLLESMGLHEKFDLCQLHVDNELKDVSLHRLTQNYSAFQEDYDEFVCTVCAPLLASQYDDCDGIIYYQAFPCLRMIQPGEFSIGPHSDVAYGHHPCSVNFYCPMTPIGGSSALFLESRMGSEDWHPLHEGDNVGNLKYFTGATCLHWTTENHTAMTRVSLDFRLIPGPLFGALQCGGNHVGGKLDVYRQRDGYYSKCVLDTSSQTWRRAGPLQSPDFRTGFPWTVQDWTRYFKKRNSKKQELGA